MQRKLAGFVIVVILLAGIAMIALRPIKNYAKYRIDALVAAQVNQHTDDTKNIAKEMDRIACEQTAQFVIENMPKVRAFPSRVALLDYSVKAVDPKADGLFCEFGVYTGSTINQIASGTDRTVHGFDSFEGLPEDWRTGLAKGAFDMEGLPTVRKNVTLYKGWFNETLPGWSNDHPGPMLFLHLDADLYSSTKTVFDILGDRIVAGTIIQFDEYFNYPSWQEGEYKAFKEFVESRNIKFEYIGYCSVHEQVAVRILSIGSSDEK